MATSFEAWIAAVPSASANSSMVQTPLRSSIPDQCNECGADRTTGISVRWWLPYAVTNL